MSPHLLTDSVKRADALRGADGYQVLRAKKGTP
jgi:hypothetical protein